GIRQDKMLASLVEAARKAEQDGRWLAFRATQPFPKDANIVVEIAAGTPSAEGPNVTPSAQSFSFRTFPPLRVDEAHCGWGGPCHPGMPFHIMFNNPLDEDRFDETQLAIAPEIPDVKIEQSGNTITVSGLTEARRTYKVT